MKIKREDFIKSVNLAQGAMKTRTTTPIMATVRLHAANGLFCVVGGDFNCFVQSSCECQGDLAPVCVSPGPIMALSGYADDTMELSLSESRLNVKCGATVRLSVLGASEYPAWPDKDMKDLVVHPADLAESILSVAWAASRDSNRGVDKQTVWISMDTKKHSLQSACMDGRRLGHFKKSAVVPNATICLLAEHAGIIVEALSGTNPTIRTSPADWLEVKSLDLACVVKQAPGYKFPLGYLIESKAKAVPVGGIPREATMKDLESIRLVGASDPFVSVTGTFTNNTLALDFVSRVNEFHSVVTVASTATPSKRVADKLLPNVAGVAVEPGLEASRIPAPIRFDAALLHNVLKHSRGESVQCSHDGNAIFFDCGDLVTALALIKLNQ